MASNPVEEQPWSWTRLRAFLECPKLFEHQYIQNMELVKRPRAFLVGSAIHRFLEVWYATWDESQALKSVRGVFDNIDTSSFSKEEMDQYHNDYAMVLGICPAYAKVYLPDKDNFSSILTEQKFKFSFGKHSFLGYVDLLVKDKEGKWWIMETKTRSMSTNISNEFRSSYINGQLLSQAYGARQSLKIPVQGVIFNIIKKPGIRLRKGETREAYRNRVIIEYTQHYQAKGYFQRFEMMLDKRHVENFLKSTKATLMVARKFYKDGFFPLNSQACDGKYGQCAFLSACLSGKYSSLLYRRKQ